jgi:hypothetical protein
MTGPSTIYSHACSARCAIIAAPKEISSAPLRLDRSLLSITIDNFPAFSRVAQRLILKQLAEHVIDAVTSSQRLARPLQLFEQPSVRDCSDIPLCIANQSKIVDWELHRGFC